MRIRNFQSSKFPEIGLTDVCILVDFPKWVLRAESLVSRFSIQSQSRNHKDQSVNILKIDGDYNICISWSNVIPEAEYRHRKIDRIFVTSNLSRRITRMRFQLSAGKMCVANRDPHQNGRVYEQRRIEHFLSRVCTRPNSRHCFHGIAIELPTSFMHRTSFQSNRGRRWTKKIAKYVGEARGVMSFLNIINIDISVFVLWRKINIRKVEHFHARFVYRFCGKTRTG